MALELFYTSKKDKAPHKWHDPNITIRSGYPLPIAFSTIMEQKYLPSLPRPEWDVISKPNHYYSRFLNAPFWDPNSGTEHPMQPVWDLQESPKVTPQERLTMASMMDRAYILVEDLPKLAEAWTKVSEMPEYQAHKDTFKTILDTMNDLVKKNPDIYSIAINWSSVVNFYDSFGETDQNCYNLIADHEERVANMKDDPEQQTEPVKVEIQDVSEIKIGKFAFNHKHRTLTRGNETMKLTAREADLLNMLCENMNDVTERKDILTKLWDSNDYFCARSMDVYITKLRKYLKPDPNVEILNIHGRGFKLIAPTK